MFQVFDENGARPLWRYGSPVKIHVFATVVRAKPNHVALVRGDVDQFVLPVETGQSGITLPNDFAFLD